MAHSTRKIGNAFTWVGWIVGFFLLVWLFEDILTSQMNPNQQVQSIQNSQYQQITLQRNRHGHYLFNGEINGETVTFMVDTGATMTSIPLHLADVLGLESGRRFSVQTANGTGTAFATRIKHMQLGHLVFTDTRASLTAGLKGNEILLGMNILKDLELVQRGDELILRQYL